MTTQWTEPQIIAHLDQLATLEEEGETIKNGGVKKVLALQIALHGTESNLWNDALENAETTEVSDAIRGVRERLHNAKMEHVEKVSAIRTGVKDDQAANAAKSTALKSDIKAAVIAHGATVTGGSRQCQWTKPRVKISEPMLLKAVKGHPEAADDIMAAIKYGDPGARIVKVKK